MAYSIEGTSYHMADCNSNGHQSSLYLQYCCLFSNRGKAFKIQDEYGHRVYILCPSVRPTSCPEFYTSCSHLYEISPTVPSGYYNITLSNGSQVEMYCDMEGSHCDGEGGWTRVAFINMSVPGSSCPPGLVQFDDIFNTSLCWINIKKCGCNSTFFSTYGLNYTKVCGQVRGYQYGYPWAFDCSIYPHFWEYCCSYHAQVKIYGLTLTFSSNPHKHIWSYVGGSYEQGTYRDSCPCNNGSQHMNYTGPFVGNDYYCESGTNIYSGYDLYADDPLWDGQDCPGHEATCCTSPKMPWFVKTLNEKVNDNIELIACGLDFGGNYFGGTPFDLVELYIK